MIGSKVRLLNHIGILLLLIVTPAMVQAQERAVTRSVADSNVGECTQELFDGAETSFLMRRFRGSEMLARAERELKEVIRLCAETPGYYQAKEHLRITQEELGESNFAIALFYLNRFYDGKGGKQGAFDRLKKIVERYPDYSKLDQVLALLARLSLADAHLEDAASYFKRIIKDFPGSQYVGEASIQLSAIGECCRE